MHLNVSDHVKEKIYQSQVETDPFPHLMIENIFPNEYYQYLVKFDIGDEYLQSLEDAGRVSNYPQGRKFISLEENMPILPRQLRDFWQETSAFINAKLTPLVMEKFSNYIVQRLGNDTSTDITSETLYVKDSKGYALSPHSDNPEKILTFLIYLARDWDHQHLGTSIYKPKDPNFSCAGGPLHPFEKFNLFKTAPYRPNTLFGFVKGDKSFHGVEPVKEDYTRNLIIYDVRVALAPQPTTPRLRFKR